MKAARILAIIFNKAKKLDASKELTEVILRFQFEFKNFSYLSLKKRT